MLKQWLVLNTLLFIALMVQAQGDTIHWSATHQVNWASYRGSITRLGYNNMASTNSGIRIDLKNADPVAWRLNIVTVFNADKSATKTDSSDYLLNHERNHFNISEIEARRLRRDLMNTPLPQHDAVRIITQVYNKHIAELEKLQDTYDKDTQHSLNHNRQAVWDRWVTEQLNILSPYSHTTVILHTQ